ncbi:MAG: tRNA adenosine(34) deaminase TadA [Candidatus Omnitrophica bacterium]|nr:tRNA adenosine(34) deaminase TadA [Candidatus Omnitrophota bacterium]
MDEPELQQRFMLEALKEAARALDSDEVPIGAVIVHKNRIIGKAFNQTRLLKDPTAHAEMIAITQAANALEHERLLDADLYVTIEPCVMCIGALIHARVSRIFFGAPNEKYGGCGSVIDVPQGGRWNHHIEINKGLMADQAALLMQEFFRKKRGNSR